MIFASDGVGAGWGFFRSVLLIALRCFAAELITAELITAELITAELITGGEFIAGVAQW